MNRRLFLATSLIVTTGLCSDVLGQSGNFRQAAEAINATIRANHFHRAELDNSAYVQIEKNVVALGERATSAEEFIEGFNALWRKGPFSHVSLKTPGAVLSSQLFDIPGGFHLRGWKASASHRTSR